MKNSKEHFQSLQSCSDQGVRWWWITAIWKPWQELANL